MRGARPPRAALAPASPRGGADDLEELRRQLAQLKGRYTDEHPDVESLRLRIARLDARLAAIRRPGRRGDRSTSIARDQLEQANREVSRLEAKRTDLESRIGGIRARIESTPKTEQELTSLSRDYDKLSENYVALLSKQLEAQMAGRLEQRWKGDRFRMLDPANLPEKPYFPRPALIIGLGFVLGLFAGVGASLVAEFADPSVKDAGDLEAVLTHPVLARIPHLAELGGPSAR